MTDTTLPTRDEAMECLLRCAQNDTKSPSGKTVWVTDEHGDMFVSALVGVAQLEVIGNRFQVIQKAKSAGITAHFNDFDFSMFESGSVQRVYYRVSKEKAVVHHIINHSWRVLVPGGELVMSGYKQEGTKTYFDKAKKLFGEGDWQKTGNAYIARCTKTSDTDAVLLDDQRYTEWRLMEGEGVSFYSKPGIFGWNKVDIGSAFLASQLQDVLAGLSNPPSSLLDLGCGYGYFLAMTKDWPLQRRVATDNNAAALQATQATAALHGLDVEVVADDFGSSLQEPFDIILCNPPFHRGFGTDDQLTHRCLCNTARLLTPNGTAVFVVNSFIPLEVAARPFFRHVEPIADCGSFKLLLLKNPVPK